MVSRLGAHSPKLDLVRALKTKAGRRTHGLYAVEGRTMLVEALAADRIPNELYATESALDTFGRDPRLAGRTYVIPDKAMARASELDSPPGLLAVHPLRFETLDDVLAGGRPALLLAGIADPGNAGTLLRSAEIFGIDTAIFAADAVEPYNAKVVRATMGAIFRMRIVVTDRAELLAKASDHGYTIVGSAREGKALPSYRFPERAILAIGHERLGVSAFLPSLTETVTVPHLGAGESLNAAVAGGIILYAFSQRSDPNYRS